MESEIIIISENQDTSTDKVLECLSFYGKKAKRINIDSDFENFNIQITNKLTTSNLENKIIWNRRGYLPIIPNILKKSNWLDYLKKEQLPVLFSLENINKKRYLGSYDNEFNNNKLLNLKIATEAGLNIPDTIVTNNKVDLLKFTKRDKKYITKSIHKIPFLETETEFYNGNGTILIDLKKTPDYFSPSLIQEYIEKEIEIRVFFIENDYYSMAIFSQNDEKTKIDFRNYNREKPNRNVPFILPENILSKLKLFNQKKGCNTGSIDLILTPQKKYVFLEINPMGQYDWVSENCNFHIDKKIAEILIEKSKKNER